MERLPRKVPGPQFDILDFILDALFGPIDDGIADMLNGLADLLDFVPIVGGTLSDLVEQIANGLNDTHSTATTAQSTATTAQSTATSAQATATAAAASASAAQTAAGNAVTAASAAANAAAAAQETADVAYGLSSYWEAECVVSSAEVLLGVNELLIGLCQNEPDDCDRFVTDIHLALKTNPGGAVIQTRKWNAAGTSDSLIHTATLGANVTRASYNALNLQMADKERVFWNVTTATPGGSPLAPPTVLQCLLFGVIIGE